MTIQQFTYTCQSCGKAVDLIQLTNSTLLQDWQCPSCKTPLNWQEAMKAMNVSELRGSKDMSPSPEHSHIELNNLLGEATKRFQQGQLKTATFMFEEAAKIMEQLPEFLSPTPDSPFPKKLASLYLQIGDCYSQLSNYENALSWYIKGQDFLAKHSLERDVMAYVSMGDAFRNLAQWDNAISLYSQGFELATTSNKSIPHSDVCYNIACCYEEKGDLIGAIQWLEKCLTYNPNDADALFNLGMFSARSDNYVRAAQALQSFIKIEPNADGANQARVALSQIYQKM
ncbi:MAG: hypothetical protein C0410_11220 [Anaerolinea sp.]|nr:hypothetical protein [Anaerolinea sp.]